MAADVSLQVKPDPALRRFFDAVDWGLVCVGHNTQLEREMQESGKKLSRVTINRTQGYKREWGRFWRSDPDLRWFDKKIARKVGLIYDPAIEAPWPVAGRRTSEVMLRRFTMKKEQYSAFLRNLASYSGWILSHMQTIVARRRGWVNVEKAIRWSEKERAKITESALLNAARKAGAKV